MAKKGFVRNAAVVGQIMKKDPGLQAALTAEAEALAEDSGGVVEQRETDRAVFVVVPAHEQAVNGSLTRAVGRRGRTLS